MVAGLFMDSDSRRAMRGMRLAVFVILLSIVACFRSCSEFKYSLWGKESIATIRSVKPSQRGELYRAVTITYLPVGATRIEQVKKTVRASKWNHAVGDEVPVQYLAGREDRPIFAFERSNIWPIILGVLVVIAAAWCGRMYWLAKQGRFE